MHTADIRSAGTDANVFVIIFGDKGDSGELSLKSSETYRDKFERGQTDTFNFNMLSLGEFILKLRRNNATQQTRSQIYMYINIQF